MSAIFLILIPFKYILILLGIILAICLICFAVYLLIEYWPLTLVVVIALVMADKKSVPKRKKLSSSTRSSAVTNSKKVVWPQWHYIRGDNDKTTNGFQDPFYIVKSKKGKCSGVVINDNYLITAYHCVENESYVSLINPKMPTWYADKTQEGVVEKINEKYDLALIKGSFMNIKKYYIYQGPGLYRPGLFTCGAPDHRRIIDCFKVSQLKCHKDFMLGEGFSRPGMSGSALVDKKNNIILGILTQQVENKFPLYMPIEKIFEHLGVNHNEVHRYVYY